MRSTKGRMLQMLAELLFALAMFVDFAAMVFNLIASPCLALAPSLIALIVPVTLLVDR